MVAPLPIAPARRRAIGWLVAAVVAATAAAGFVVLLLQIGSGPRNPGPLLRGLFLAGALPVSVSFFAWRALRTWWFARRQLPGTRLRGLGRLEVESQRHGILVRRTVDHRRWLLDLRDPDTGGRVDLVEVAEALARACGAAGDDVVVHRDDRRIHAIEHGGRTWWPPR